MNLYLLAALLSDFAEIWPGAFSDLNDTARLREVTFDIRYYGDGVWFLEPLLPRPLGAVDCAAPARRPKLSKLGCGWDPVPA